MPETKERIGKTFAGQGWVELHGTFTFDELKILAQNVEKEYRKANNGDKN
jgi:hypothetical protein